MKKLLNSALLLIFVSNFAFAQDTTIIQTLDFNDITKRRGWYNFPADTSYQKVLMYYTLKCDPQTTQDGYACGEWDYTTYTNLYQHNNVGSSRYQVNGTYPDTINSVINPTYTYYQNQQYFIVYDNVTSQTDYSVGAGSTPITHSFDATNNNGKAQYLWLASELTSAGLTAGNIDKLKLDFSSLGSDLDYLTIRIKHTPLNVLSETAYETTGFTEVYKINTNIPATGINTLNLTTPFNWDGVSNLVVEFSFSNAGTGTGHTIVGETTGFNSGVYSPVDDGTLEFVWGDYIDIPGTAFAAVDSFITISFWQFGDPNALPENTYMFEGKDANGYRVINSHLPWGNSNVYWDAGNSGTNSYDRINQVANAVDFEGQWNHWAFTKDVSTGEMKIYLNGTLWHSGTGMTRTMSGITTFRIGGQANVSGKYDGTIHEFRVFNKALDATTIQDWMYKDITPSHPYYANLQAYYQFEEMAGYTSSDASVNSNTGNLIGTPAWKYIKGWDLYRNMIAVNERPNITFTQGIYSTHIDSMMVLDSVMNSPVSIIQYGTSIDTNNSGVTMTPIDTTYGWQDGWVYTYDQYGNVVDSMWVNYNNQYFNDYSQVTFQLQNYVTPYGIGLSLGTNGFRWVYDVTDYQRLFHDLVEISAGNQQELIDLKFVMIKGTPPRDVIKIESLHNGDYSHANIANNVSLPGQDVVLDPTASSFRLKTRTSGHWFGGFQNCAEFCPKLHHIEVDGTMRFQWNNWKTNCAENPVIAQGGTWIYDRAAWCPGTFTDTYDWELTPYVTPGATANIDYGMQTTAGGMEGNYRTTMLLVTYGANNFNLDARIDEIISPNDWEFHNRVNPICADPVVVIQNTGSTTLTSLDITYNVRGGVSDSYNWTGSLAFMEKDTVTLPISNQGFWNTSLPTDIFEVIVSNPNGGTDEYADNNMATATFDRPDVYAGKFLFRIQTNLAGWENSYTIKDDQGNVVLSRGAMASSTTYNDTIDLPDGCYVLDYLDSDEDGMSFFANSDGSGTFRFQWIPPATPFLHTFNAKFGSFVKYYFVVNHSVGVDAYNKFQDVEVYPNPSSDVFNLTIVGFENETINVGIYNAIGEALYTESVTSVNGQVKTSFDLSDQPNGIYFVRVFADGAYTVKKLIKN